VRSRKKYSNATFTKRVDHEGGEHRPPRAIPEPAVCEGCGAVLVDQHWVSPATVEGRKKHPNLQGAASVLCPACWKEREGLPCGIVSLSGGFVARHMTEIENLIRHEAERAAEGNPLARIMQWESSDDAGISIATTTDHLAQRLGRALERAYGGEVHYQFSHENKLTRVTWRRD
jgi:NMD protein affecting ribosome stability and mRNA decay